MVESRRKIVIWDFLTELEREESKTDGSVLIGLAVERARTEGYWREKLLPEDIEKIATAIQNLCEEGHPELPAYDYSKSSVENFMTCSCPAHKYAAKMRTDIFKARMGQ